MKDFKIRDGSQGQYILFKSVGLENRVVALHLSNVYNKTGKFKVLEQVSTNNKATFEGKTMEIRDLLLKVKVNGQKVFDMIK